MDQNEKAVFQQAIEACEDPAEIARKVKLAFKRMPGEMALACFAQVMTAELPHPIKVAVWDDDQNAAGGFAYPKTVAALLERGVDPSRRNNLGLCWNDVARHVVRLVV